MRWLWLLYLILIFGLSSIPGSATVAQTPRHLDKAVHFVLYMGLTISFIRNSGIAGKKNGMALVVAILLAATVGFLDELYQGLIPQRSQESVDWIADLLGGSCGALLALKMKWTGRKPEKRDPE
jgi:VanZ family protein